MEDSLESVYFQENDHRAVDLSKSVRNKNTGRYELVPDPPDGGYGWIVVLASSVSAFVLMMSIANLGILFVEFAEHFNVTKTYLSWIGSIMLVARVILSPFFPALLRRFSARMVSIVGSIGFSLAYLLTSMAPNALFLFFSMGVLIGVTTPPLVVAKQVSIHRYFDKKRTLATSMSIVGTAVAMFAWPPFTRYLIDIYTWRGATLLLSGISLNGVVFVSLLRPPPMKMVLKKSDSLKKQLLDETTQSNPGNRLLDRVSSLLHKYLTYILIFCGLFCCHAGHVVTIVYTPVRASVMGLSKTEGALLLSILGVASGFARVPVGFIGDLKCVVRNALAGSMVLVCGGATIVSTFFTGFTSMAAYCAMYGLCSAFYVALHGSCLYDVFGLKKISLGYSIFHISTGISSFISMPIAGYLFDVTGRSLETMVTFGVVQIIGGIFFISIPFAQKYLTKRDQKIIEATTSSI